MKNSQNKKGFSLTELLMVVVVLGALAALTIPNFTKTIVKEKARQAVTYLRLIKTGEVMYRADNATGEYANCTNAAAIQTLLGVSLTEENFTFSVATSDQNTNFTATADYTADAGVTFVTIDQDGTIVGHGQMQHYVS